MCTFLFAGMSTSTDVAEEAKDAKDSVRARYADARCEPLVFNRRSVRTNVNVPARSPQASTPRNPVFPTASSGGRWFPSFFFFLFYVSSGNRKSVLQVDFTLC